MSKGFCMISPLHTSVFLAVPQPVWLPTVPLLDTLFLHHLVGWGGGVCRLKTHQKGFPWPSCIKTASHGYFYHSSRFPFTDVITTCHYFTWLFLLLDCSVHKLFCSPAYPQRPTWFPAHGRYLIYFLNKWMLGRLTKRVPTCKGRKSSTSEGKASVERSSGATAPPSGQSPFLKTSAPFQKSCHYRAVPGI